MPEIIAEFCQNHLGDREIMKRMIDQAVSAGADFAKIQTIHSEDLSHRQRFEEGVMKNGKVEVIKRPFQPEYERLKAIDIDLDTHRWFIDQCHQSGIKALTTAFTRGVVDELGRMEWDGIKVASYDCASFPLLRDLAEKFDRIFVSTGATYDHEIERAAGILKEKDLTLLHCVTIYPTPLDQLHLKRMGFLRKYSSKVGFSDHSLVARDGIKASLAALHLGADVIERHFTVLEEDKTKDGPVSINQKQLENIVRFAHLSPNEQRAIIEDQLPEFTITLGESHRGLSKEELLNRDYYRGRFVTKAADGTEKSNWEED